jgi:hypothetical protein
MRRPYTPKATRNYGVNGAGFGKQLSGRGCDDPRRVYSCHADPVACVGGTMTRGQIAQLQELSKCYMPRRDKAWLKYLSLDWYVQGLEFIKDNKKQLRRLRHVYRNQIAAMKKNRGKA